MSHNQDYNILIRCDINPTIERNNILIYRQDILYRIYTSQCHLYTILHLLQGQFSNANNYIISLKSTLHLNYDKSQVASEEAHSSFLPYDQHISAGDGVFATLVDSSILAVYEVYVHIISSIRPTSDSSGSGDDKHNSGLQTHALEVERDVDIYTRIDNILTSIHDIRLHLIDPDSGSDSADDPKPEKGAMILSPKWVQKVSYFTRTFASIVPLLIQSLYYNIIQPASPSLEGPIAQVSSSGSSSGGGRKASPGLSSSGSDATTTVTFSSSVTTANLDGSGSSSAVGVQKQSSSSSTSVGAGVVYVNLDGVDKHSEGYKSTCDAVYNLKDALIELLGMLHFIISCTILLHACINH